LNRVIGRQQVWIRIALQFLERMGEQNKFCNDLMGAARARARSFSRPKTQKALRKQGLAKNDLVGDDGLEPPTSSV
jgi:hypothetical protein